MKKNFITFFILLFTCYAYAQQLGQVSFLNGSTLSYFSIVTDQNFMIRISADGTILEWGTEILSDRIDYYAPKLQPYMGRVEYYSPESDSVFRGKLKSVGPYSITYYGAYEEEKKRGKLKSLGMLAFDYYSNYDEESRQGKLKIIGDLFLDYYDRFENEAYRGKLKAIGSIPISYYSGFDDKYNSGKLKSIGTASYTWYTQFDYAKGGLKSNNYRQVVGGITMILR